MLPSYNEEIKLTSSELLCWREENGALSKSLIEYCELRHIDIEFANASLEVALLSGQKIDDTVKSYLVITVALLSLELAEQNVCFNISSINWRNPFNLSVEALNLFTPFIAPDAALEKETSIASINSVLSNPAIALPFVLHHTQLFLARYWRYETIVAEGLRALANKATTFNEQRVKNIIDSLFDKTVIQNQHITPANNTDEVDWQRVAVAIAAKQQFAVITGGPGTGKTTTVARLLALIATLHPKTNPVIEIVAPTGKAAVRLTESIKNAKSKLNVDSRTKNCIPDNAKTIHRLLQPQYLSSHFKRDHENPIHADVLVVDEASMIDIALMAKLIQALPAYVHLILLGDQEQLASVEAGCVLADICAPLNGSINSQPLKSIKSAPAAHLSATQNQWIQKVAGVALPHGNSEKDVCHNAIVDSVIALQKSHRFKADSGIGQLAKAVNTNDKALLDQVFAANYAELTFYGQSAKDYESLIKQCANAYKVYLNKMRQKEPIRTVIEAFNTFQLLVAVKEGRFGVNELNDNIEKVLARSGHITANQRFYAGRPIMIQQNDYDMQLFNGDIGLLLPDYENEDPNQHKQLKAWFIAPDQSLNAYYPSRLPMHDTVFAMTVHKSQGSEFDTVVLALPELKNTISNKVMSKELVYTGITRAKNHFTLYAGKRVLSNAMARSIKRQSGLIEKLYG
ncbi:exodeoxyribonuclease V subunit alpha [Flocculibacter collagenilyticus]|uniref:exodeoxyribonuclease V subunit alpha n=1 Tax=Flocculibacter collagenilyticus TaxID=2744479 RepID=UPI0018F6A470|nr:exodeoxyribonuclease V subunit alpha [Flocculibacter collagenilyticus]